MSDPNQTTNAVSDNGQSVTANGQITVAIVLLTMVLIIAILILYLRHRGYTGALAAPSRHSRRLVFASNERRLPSEGLDRSILDSLPITVYRSEGDGEGLECAVCICELTDGEKARFLPKCHHVFHVDCIDMWFHSNSTCPLCRIPVRASIATDDESSVKIEIRSNREEGTSSSSSSSCSSSRRRELVIEIPRRVMEGFSSPHSAMPSSKMTVEPSKSPTLEKLRSLRRMMSRGRGKEVSSSCTPRAGCDIEEGEIRGLEQQLIISF